MITNIRHILKHTQPGPIGRGFKRKIVEIKGTVRPDWICMRVVSLERTLKGHQPLYVFNFLFLILNILQDFKVLAAPCKNESSILNPDVSVHGLHRILSSYWLAYFYLMKKSTKV